MRRREFIASGALAAGALLYPGGLRRALAAPARAGASPYGPLVGPDANGLMLPQGFTSRRIARSLETVPGTSYLFPVFPDGQATFRTGDGGWILVTNSESLAPAGAGASAVRFGPDGTVVGAYRILGDTNTNCAGGPTTVGHVAVLRGDGQRPGLGVRPGRRAGRGAAPRAGGLQPRGGGGRPRRRAPVPHRGRGRRALLPLHAARLSRAWPTVLLEVAVVAPGRAASPGGGARPHTAESGVPTRAPGPRQATRFRGGEGIWYARDVLYFTTKGDRKVWAYDAARAS